ncbi:MAG: tRNA dihydrouridine synthase DusB [Eubacteriaceae bacterium]
MKLNAITIRNLHIENPLFLGPMAGYTNLPFRVVAKEYGAGVVCTEMVSGKGLYYKDRKTEELMATIQEETPVGVQIFGSDPEILEEVVVCYLNEKPHNFIDFNAGCPAPKITKNGEGSALLKTPQLFSKVVRSIVNASKKPVFVKTRIGWDDQSINIREIAEIIEEAGADVLTIHGRTREAFYSGKANWEIIGEVKKNIRIPVILNGDIKNGEDALRALEMTGVDGLMVGRAAIGNPFIFREINGFLETGITMEKATPEEKVRGALKNVELLSLLKNEEAGLREMRKHLAAYTKGLKNATILRNEIFRAKDKASVRHILSSVVEDNKNN